MKSCIFFLLAVTSLFLCAIITLGTTKYVPTPSQQISNPVVVVHDIIAQLQQQLNETRRENEFLRKKLEQASQTEAITTTRREEQDEQSVKVKSSRPSSTTITTSSSVSNITVPTMCRCNARDLPIVFNRSDDDKMLEDTHIEQPPSLATGNTTKHFYRRPNSCKCDEGKGTETYDRVMSKLIEMRTKNCKPLEAPGARMKWEEMPDLAIREDIPLFLGVLSYEAPQSLNMSIMNWTEHLFPHIHFNKVYVQLNHRSEADDAVLEENPIPNMQVFGTKEENLNPGLAISRFCRQAEEQTGTADNLLLFLEKDWHVGPKKKERLYDSIRSSKILLQRGVFYARLSHTTTVKTRDGPPISWPCHAGNITWTCIRALHHHYTNLPAIIHCGWFLRYMEPYALIDDPLMYGCRRMFRNRTYVDWEQVLEDGRVPWVETQWVVASNHMGLFRHYEVDQ